MILGNACCMTSAWKLNLSTSLHCLYLELPPFDLVALLNLGTWLLYDMGQETESELTLHHCLYLELSLFDPGKCLLDEMILEATSEACWICGFDPEI